MINSALHFLIENQRVDAIAVGLLVIGQGACPALDINATSRADIHTEKQEFLVQMCT